MRILLTVLLALVFGAIAAGALILRQEGHLDRWLKNPLEGKVYENCAGYGSLTFRSDGRVEMRSSLGIELYDYEMNGRSEVVIKTPLMTLAYPVASDGTLTVERLSLQGRVERSLCRPGERTGTDVRANAPAPRQAVPAARQGDQKVEATLSQVQALHGAVRTLYASQSSYQSLDGDLIVAARKAPPGALRNGRMVNQWGGGITMTGYARFPGRFSVLLHSVPEAGCVDLLTSRGYEMFATAGLFSIAAIPMDFRTRPSVARAREVCDTFNNMRFTFDDSLRR